MFSLHPVYPKRTALVLIKDDEYWKGELARRVPIKRTYLAKLLRKIDQAEPAVIAFDFDLRSPTIDGSLLEHPDYKLETDELLLAINEVGSRRAVVLSRTVRHDDHGQYIVEPAVFDSFQFHGRRVFTGYINLPHDQRRVPYPLPLGKGGKQDSFASAMARASGDPYALELGGETSVPYGTFITRDGFKPVSYSASEVLGDSADELRMRLGHRIVIVGAAWSKWAYGRGEPVDSYLSPIGFVGGVFLHANYVEAMLDSRIYTPLSKTGALAIEACSVVVVCALVILIAYVFWQNLGLFFNFFIPIVLLAAHAVIEQVVEWRADAKAES